MKETLKTIVGLTIIFSVIATSFFVIIKGRPHNPESIETPITSQSDKFGIVEIDNHEYIFTAEGGICHKYDCKYD